MKRRDIQRIIKARFERARTLSEVDILHGTNFAYQKGMSTEEPIIEIATIIDDARRTGNPLALICVDIAKYFDVVDIPVLLYILESFGFPPATRRLVWNKLWGADITVATPYGPAPPFKRRIGIEQGSILSCVFAILVLDVYQRRREDILLPHTYRLDLGGAYGMTGTLARHLGYSDDQTAALIGTGHHLQRGLRKLGVLHKALRLGCKETKCWIAQYNFTTSDAERTYRFPMRSPGDRHEEDIKLQPMRMSYRLLGVDFGKTGVPMQRHDKKRERRILSKLIFDYTKEYMLPREVANILKTVVIPRFC